jgi:hypothetical protein
MDPDFYECLDILPSEAKPGKSTAGGGAWQAFENNRHSKKLFHN